MCPPQHFEVTYAINPWMNTQVPVDVDRAQVQWEVLRNTYLSLGHKVELIEPMVGQPDMVFAANGGLVVGKRAYGAKFRFPERTAEGIAYGEWLYEFGIDVTLPAQINEGEGDFLALKKMILAGTGFRTSLEAHIEAANARSSSSTRGSTTSTRRSRSSMTAMATPLPTSPTSPARSAGTASAHCATCSPARSSARRPTRLSWASTP
jgi:N-dimethylarginine dimethylaminohydrolase